MRSMIDHFDREVIATSESRLVMNGALLCAGIEKFDEVADGGVVVVPRWFFSGSVSESGASAVERENALGHCSSRCCCLHLQAALAHQQLVVGYAGGNFVQRELAAFLQKVLHRDAKQFVMIALIAPKLHIGIGHACVDRIPCLIYAIKPLRRVDDLYTWPRLIVGCVGDHQHLPERES